MFGGLDQNDATKDVIDGYCLQHDANVGWKFSWLLYGYLDCINSMAP